MTGSLMETIPGSVEISQKKDAIFNISKIALLAKFSSEALFLLRSRINVPTTKTVKLK